MGAIEARRVGSSRVTQLEGCYASGAWPAGRPGKAAPVQWPDGSLLATLGPSARAQLMGLGTTQTYDKPRILIREGEPTTDVILLRSALAKVTGRSENGRECLLASG